MVSNNATKSPNASSGDLPFARSLRPLRKSPPLAVYGTMMRLAKWTESANSEPPNPRLITGNPGKSDFNPDHMRILELPTKTMQSLGGGFVQSLASNAAISCSHFSECWDEREFGGCCPLIDPGLANRRANQDTETISSALWFGRKSFENLFCGGLRQRHLARGHQILNQITNLISL